MLDQQITYLIMYVSLLPSNFPSPSLFLIREMLVKQESRVFREKLAHQ